MYRSDSWEITRRDLKRLNSFYLSVVRYMRGSHIRCENDEWEYLNHNLLLKKCRLHPIEVYTQRRRGTLWNYLLNNKKELLEKLNLILRMLLRYYGGIKSI